MKNNRLTFHHIPIYDFRLWIGVYNKKQGLAQRNKLNWAFGPCDNYDEWPGVVYYNRSKIFVQFGTSEISHSLIAHEMFHVVNRMLEYVELPLTEKTHESHAYLAGYVTQLVYQDLAKWRVPVKLTAPLPPSIRQKL